MLVRKSERTGHRAAIYALAPAENGFVSASADGFLVHWDRRDVDFGQVIARVEGGKFLSIRNLGGNQWAAGALDGGLHWLCPDAPAENRHVKLHRRGLFALCLAGTELFSGGGDGVLTRWSVTERRSLESLPLSPNSLRSIWYDPAGDHLVVGASDGHVYWVSRSDFSVRARAPASAPSTFCVVGDPRNGTVFYGGRDAHLARTQGPGSTPTRVPAHLSTVNALALHPAGHLLASASRDKTVKLWRAHDLSLRKVLEPVRDRGHVNSVNTLLWLDERTLLSAGDDRRILEWTLTDE